MSVVEKCAAADTVIWLDEVKYTHGGWTNRNRLPSGAWLTVPVGSGASQMPINRVRVSDHREWRARACRSLQHEYAGTPWLDEVCDVLARPYRLLVGLNVALLQVVARDLPIFLFQSHIDGGRAVRAVSDNPLELAPISERLAMMVEEVGGDVYLSGPSGRGYLNEQPFVERGIRVDYWSHDGANPCVLAALGSAHVR